MSQTQPALSKGVNRVSLLTCVLTV